MIIPAEKLLIVPNTAAEITCPYCGRRDQARHFYLVPLFGGVSWQTYEVYCCHPQKPFYLRTRTFTGG
ncbi:MAG: hypothetical protein D6736_01640 [Nitrospinota bacterium]|nr:MAG: hypothetical protein D6736_01640 [Nitrospinota bacterium]